MVSSITANTRTSASAGVELRVGDSDDFAGNLTALSGRAIYEENPMISYSPVNAGQNARAGEGINFVTRSVYDLVKNLAAAIEVPETDVRNGVIAEYREP